MSFFIRLLLCVALLGCGSPQLAGMSTAHATELASGASQTVTLQVGQIVALGGQTEPQVEKQGLRIELLEFKDSRCPTGAQCIWAGHATATLRITRAGAAEETIVIGTQAPPAMQLPYQATSGPYQFTLLSLEPRPTSASQAQVPVASIRASVLVEKR